MLPKTIIIFIFLASPSTTVTNAQTTTTPPMVAPANGLYPPYTKWYQDPLGLQPLELSTAFGFVWGASAVAASLIFTKKDPAEKERISFYQETAFGLGYKPPYTRAWQNEMGIVYIVRKWMAMGLGWDVFHFKDDINDTWAFGIRPFARWYPYTSKRVRLFVEYGAGGAYSLQRFPLTGTGWGPDTARTGTRVNLLSKYSIGAECQLNGLFALYFGARHFHLSNGNLAGIQRNPSYDNNSFFIGCTYQPPGKSRRH